MRISRLFYPSSRNVFKNHNIIQWQQIKSLSNEATKSTKKKRKVEESLVYVKGEIVSFKNICHVTTRCSFLNSHLSIFTKCVDYHPLF